MKMKGHTIRIMRILLLSSFLSMGYTSAYSHTLLLRSKSAITGIIQNLENAANNTTDTSTPEPPTSEPPTPKPPTPEPLTPEPPTPDPPITEPSSTEPPTPEPPTTEPPSTEPPTPEPPSTEPPSTEPPSTEPPSKKPPTPEQPSTEPPSTEPPSSEPPTPESPSTEPPSTEPPTPESLSTEPPSTEPPTPESLSTEPPTIVPKPVTSSRKKRSVQTIYYSGICSNETVNPNADEVIALIECSLTNLKFSTINEGMVVDLEVSEDWSSSIDLSMTPVDDINAMKSLAEQKLSDMSGYLGVALNSPFFLAFICGVAAALVLLFIGFIQIATPARAKKVPLSQQQSPKKSPKKVERSPTQREFEETRLHREREARKKERTTPEETDSFDRDSLPSVLPENDDVFYGAYKKTSFKTFGHNRNPNDTSQAQYAAPNQATTVPDAGPRKESSVAAPPARKPSVKKLDNQISRPVSVVYDSRKVSGVYGPGSGVLRPVSGVYAPDSRPVSGHYGPRIGDPQPVSAIYGPGTGGVGYPGQQNPVRKKHYDYLMEEKETTGKRL